MRLVGYIRVSKVAGRSGDSFQSPDQQRDAIGHAVALRPGAEVVEWITDLDESGGTMDRPGLGRALEMLETGRADGIVVAKLDRFARNAAAIDSIEELEKAGKVFISAADNFDTTTSVGRFALGMMVLVAKLERDRHIETWDVSARRAIERGVHTVVPYGYRRANGKGSPLVVHEPEAQVVRRIFADRQRGLGVSVIADSLNADAVPAPRSAMWTRQSVRAIIKTRTYLGEARYGEHVLAAAHPPLVGEDTWRLAQPSPHDTRSKGAPSLLAGVVRCGGCGYSMGSSDTGRNGRRFNCNRHHATGRCPAPTSAPVIGLEQLVTAAFLERYGSAEVLGAAASDPAVVATKAELERVQRDYVAWRDDTELREALGDDEYRAGLIARKHAVDEARDAHDGAVRNADASNLAVSEEVWEQLDIPDRRVLLRAGLDAVVLGRAASTHTPLADRVDILWAGEAPDDLVRCRHSGPRPDRDP